MSDVKAMRLSGVAFDILAIEDGTGQAAVTVIGPESLQASTLAGLFANLIAMGYETEVMIELMRGAEQSVQGYSDAKNKAIDEGGADPEEAYSMMMGAMNHMIASESVKIASEAGELDGLFEDKESLAEKFGVADKKIIV